MRAVVNKRVHLVSSWSKNLKTMVNKYSGDLLDPLLNLNRYEIEPTENNTHAQAKVREIHAVTLCPVVTIVRCQMGSCEDLDVLCCVEYGRREAQDWLCDDRLPTQPGPHLNQQHLVGSQAAARLSLRAMRA